MGEPSPQARRGPGRGPGSPGTGRQAGAGPWKAAFFALTAVAIVAGVVWALLGSSLLVVRSVVVTGNRSVTRAEVLRAAAIEPGTALARVDTAAVARRVERMTRVQSAQVSKDWPDSVSIVIRERTPALAVASGGGFALVDRFGVVVSHVASRPPGMVLLVTAAAPAPVRGDPAIGAAATVLAQLPPQIRLLVHSVTAPSPGAVTLDLRNGITVRWGGTDRPAAKAAELEVLMRSKARSYDISDPGTAVTGG